MLTVTESELLVFVFEASVCKCCNEKEAGHGGSSSYRCEILVKNGREYYGLIVYNSCKNTTI